VRQAAQRATADGPDPRAMQGHESIRHDDKAAARLASKGDDGRFDLTSLWTGALIGTTLSDRAAVSNGGIK
jgi:hypothetical protein